MVERYLFVQTLLESLPISSSTHVSLLGLSASRVEMFVAHIPTVLVLLFYFGGEVFAMMKGSRSLLKDLLHYCWILGLAGCGMVAVVFSTLFISQKMPFMYGYLYQAPQWVGLLLTGIILVAERWLSGGVSSCATPRQAILIGLAQGVAFFFPGVSRFGLTYGVGRMAGLSPSSAFRFSCAILFPVIALASLGTVTIGLLMAPDLLVWITARSVFTMVIAGVGAYYVLWLVEVLFERRKAWYFGLYLIGLALFIVGQGYLPKVSLQNVDISGASVAHSKMERDIKYLFNKDAQKR